MKMMFQLREQIERLQTVDTERLEKIIVRSKLLAAHFEVSGSKIQYLVECLVRCTHNLVYIETTAFHGK